MFQITFLKNPDFEFDTSDNETVFAKNLSSKQVAAAQVCEIKDLAYWDALVLWDFKNERALAVRSMVIGLNTATRIIKDYLHDELPF